MKIIFQSVETKKDWSQKIFESWHFLEQENFNTHNCPWSVPFSDFNVNFKWDTKCEHCEHASKNEWLVIVPFSCGRVGSHYKISQSIKKHRNTSDFTEYLIRELTKLDHFPVRAISSPEPAVLVTPLRHLEDASYNYMILCLDNCKSSQVFFGDIVATLKKTQKTLIVLIRGEPGVKVKDSITFIDSGIQNYSSTLDRLNLFMDP